MRRDQSPFHHVVYLAIYGSLITLKNISGENSPIFLLPAADTNLQHAVFWLCPHEDFFLSNGGKKIKWHHRKAFKYSSSALITHDHTSTLTKVRCENKQRDTVRLTAAPTSALRTTSTTPAYKTRFIWVWLFYNLWLLYVWAYDASNFLM